MVEYILMLVVVVGLILGARRAFTNVNEFMASYIGDYVACLMEYGELPSLGVGEADLKKHEGSGKVCDANFSDFTFTGGLSFTGGTGGTGSTVTTPGGTGGTGGTSGTGSGRRSGMSNSRNSSRNANNDGSDAETSATARRAASGANGASGAGRGGRDGSGRSPYDSGRLKRSSNTYGTADSFAGGDGNEKVAVLADAGEDADGKGRRGRRSGRYRGNRYIYNNNNYKAVTGRMAEEIEKAQPKKPPVKRTSVSQLPEEGSFIGPYKKKFTPPEKSREVASVEEDSGFSFGNIFRWLLIGGMIVAIVVFFGGQILNYSNSKD